MKWHYDRNAVLQPFKPNDKVLALLPLPGSALAVKLVTQITLLRHDQRRKTRVYHINMFKPYYDLAILLAPETPTPMLATTAKQSTLDSKYLTLPTSKLTA